MFAADNIDVTLVEFAEASFLGTFATEIKTDLRYFEGECEAVFMFNDVAS